jgi:very-short-patch-repair endonuclease
MCQKLTISEIILRTEKLFGDKYIIPEQNYIDSYAKLKVICKIHGEFTISSKNLLSGHGCKKCAGIEKIELSEIRERCNEKFGDQFIIPEQEYLNSKSKLKVICKFHPNNNWYVSIGNLLKNKGCPICNKKQKLTIEDVRIKCDEIHKNNGYIIENQKYVNNCTYINIICPIHGTWSVQPNNLFNGCGCPKCKESKGEKKIRNFLIENNINYTSQKKFKDCKYIKELLFDFYLTDYNICIEYDGKQHFESFRFEKTSKELEKRILKDKIKTDYCIKNDILLYRIRYDENINEKMSFLLKIIKNEK